MGSSRLEQVQRILAWLAFPSIVFALYMGLIWAPPERTLGDIQRIFYFHVGSAWNAYLAFFVVFAFSIAYLVRRRPAWDAVAVSAAEIGIVFTILTLVTGTFWARVNWGVWWTWDPRLSTTAIMLFMYVAYLLIRAASEGEDRRGRLGAIFGIIAFANVPLVHYSTTWWRSMHPTVIDTEGASMQMDGQMVVAMLIGLVALSFVAAYLFTYRYHLETVARRVNVLKERVRAEVEH